MHKLSVEDIFIKSVHFEINEDFDASDGPADFEYQIKFESSQTQEQVIKTQLAVKSPEKTENNQLPFYFELTATGRFMLNGYDEDNEIEKLKNINCPAMIFPYLREALADLTRRAGFPPLHLPSVNFVKLNNGN